VLKIEKIVAATANPKKLEELKRLLDDFGLEVLSPGSFNRLEEVEETGTTFEENAHLKALSYAKQTGMPCVADDSGLEVDALDGAPGIYSSRYAGTGADGSALCGKLLREIHNVPEGKRGAGFQCSIAFANDGKVVLLAQGEVRGRIIREMRGSNGFGYDPVFVPEGFEKTFAEMEPDEKDSLSHRAKALAAFKEKLKRLLAE
jgi:XTP/dITP diphosphohydrolase